MNPGSAVVSDLEGQLLRPEFNRHDSGNIIQNSLGPTPHPGLNSYGESAATKEKMSLEAELSVTVTGTEVEFEFSVENAGLDALQLDFRNGQIADVAVLDADHEVWRWSDGRLFTQALHSERLEPGETFIETMAWSDPAPGEYEARATLEASNLTVEARSRFDVT